MLYENRGGHIEMFKSKEIDVNIMQMAQYRYKAASKQS